MGPIVKATRGPAITRTRQKMIIIWNIIAFAEVQFSCQQLHVAVQKKNIITIRSYIYSKHKLLLLLTKTVKLHDGSSYSVWGNVEANRNHRIPFRTAIHNYICHFNTARVHKISPDRTGPTLRCASSHFVTGAQGPPPPTHPNYRRGRMGVPIFSGVRRGPGVFGAVCI